MAGIIGYFAIMLVFMIIAVVRAKNGSPWIWYIIGAVIQLISLIGLSRNPFYSTGPYWIAYLCILVLFFIIILSRSSKKGDSEIHYVPGKTEAQGQTPVLNYPPAEEKGQGNQAWGYPAAEEKKQKDQAWICNRCGNSNSAHVFICRCGMKKSENESGAQKPQELSSDEKEDIHDSEDVKKAYVYKYRKTDFTQYDFRGQEYICSVRDCDHTLAGLIIFGRDFSWKCLWTERVGNGGQLRIVDANTGAIISVLSVMGNGSYDIGMGIKASGNNRDVQFFFDDERIMKTSYVQQNGDGINSSPNKESVLYLEMEYTDEMEKELLIVMMVSPIIIDISAGWQRIR